MKRIITMVLATGSFLCVHAQQDARLNAMYQQVRENFNGQNAYNTVAYVEQRWRLPGNTGFNESIWYVESLLKQAGFVQESQATAATPLTYRVEKRPMRRKTWEPVNAFLCIAGSNDTLLRFSTNRNMLAVNSAATNGVLELPVVYLPKLDAGEIDKLDLTGKLVFAEGPISRVHSATSKKGTAGAISYQLPAYTQPEKHVNSIQFSSIPFVEDNKQFGILLSTQAYKRLKAALAANPNLRLKVMTDAKSYDAEELTLVADIKGAVKPEERFVFSAHVQEPGANDNATGVGTLAEMARVAAKLVQEGKFKPERSVTFLWGDEISSTRRYIVEDSIRAQGIRWGMSLDMVGEDVSKTGGTFLIEKMPDPSAVWTRGEEKHTEWGGRPLPESAIVPHYFNEYILNRCLDQAATNGWVVKTNPFEGGSDHTPFLNAKIPGILLWHFTDVFYHTDADRLENVSPQEMTNVGISAMVAAMALTQTNPSTAAYLIDEYRRSAIKRLDVEFALSKKEVENGKKKEDEIHILDVWGKYFYDSLEKMVDVVTTNDQLNTIKSLIGDAREAVKRYTETLKGKL